ncbi:hypothetical protein D3OALGA1CA_4830 [Olavius algarvensis associated proteobacterium Delta 3]|nr:hypothetical protein D3OALGB2SA_683 [Olavius algarvensis associated proteobacterium Delta 3]CAB5157571.1 hypothetical protein D3OALGA1CA_4830 [Olavius algarvensis associated proteobacterium Delta 3]
MAFRRVTKDELTSRLDDPQIIVIDMRSNWAGSSLKIRRARREDPADVESWMDSYPKGTEIVLYCSSPGEEDSLRAAERLSAAGFENVSVLSGGWAVWETSRLPMEKRIPDPLPKGVVPNVGKP